MLNEHLWTINFMRIDQFLRCAIPIDVITINSEARAKVTLS